MDILRALPADLPAVAEIYGREARAKHTRESTVHVAPGGQGRGTGRTLYDDRACGFEEVGTMRQAGRRFIGGPT